MPVTAKIKWFDPRKGYGFAKTEDGRDVFIHHSTVESGRTFTGFRLGDRITCELEDSEKGTRAVHVNLKETK